MSACPQVVDRSKHQRHRPERTTFHAIVREHLDAFVRHTDEHYARPLPRYVREAFKSYVRCGIPEHGFLRLRCDDCGHDRVVAFSCKQRGVCPSCAGRTMTNTAAHLVDRVLPNVPIRQWVLSLPFPLRALAARRADVVAAIDRILFAEIQRALRRGSGPKNGRAGAVTIVQRFGGSLNLHVHFHVLALEGLFTRDGDALPIFHPALPPTRSELLEVLTRVRAARGGSRAPGSRTDTTRATIRMPTGSMPARTSRCNRASSTSSTPWPRSRRAITTSPRTPVATPSRSIASTCTRQSPSAPTTTNRASG